MNYSSHLVGVLVKEEHGVASVEYALLAVLIAATCASIVTALSATIGDLYNVVCIVVSTAISGSPAC